MQLEDLRDYMTTELLGHGIDPKVMAERGGWAHVTTPLNIYSAFRPACDQAAAEALAARIDSSQPRVISADGSGRGVHE